MVFCPVSPSSGTQPSPTNRVISSEIKELRWLTRFATLVALSLLLAAPSAPARAGQTAAGTSGESTTRNSPRLVKEWTTKPEFLSPLVDHLPKKAGVPTPKDILGYHIGEPKKLTYTADQQRFFRALEKALPGRVKTIVAGKTEEGRDILVVFISSEANLKNLEANRQNLKRLADPRGLQRPTRRSSSPPPSRTIT